jgi:organic radical activating enzyme
MKVKELISKLQKLQPDFQVWVGGGNPSEITPSFAEEVIQIDTVDDTENRVEIWGSFEK